LTWTVLIMAFALPALAIKSLDDITVGATYHMILTTGDELEGIVESKNDTSLILECKGTPYTFVCNLIIEYKLLAPPREAKTAAAPPKNDSATSLPKAIVPEVYDTLIIKNSQTDEYGKPKENQTLVGKITKETDKTLSFVTNDNVSGDYSFDRIVQIFRHSQENPETEIIRRYALPLICPPGMMLVDVPPGKAGRPFLKLCIDKYEYPNKEGAVPRVSILYAEAAELCRQQGKRLCTSQEWQWACSGLDGYPYSYGWTFDKNACNTEGRTPEPSGNRSHCTGKFGVYDMVGNVFEWVKGSDGTPAAMGGPLSKCQAVAAGGHGDAKPQTGFRCCKSN
jgi:hypothetical protein